MSFTYGTLKTTVQNYLDTEETAFVATLPTFITTAEERILKSANLNVFRKNVTGQLTAGNTYLTKPTDFIRTFSLAVIENNVYDYLLLKHASFMREYSNDATTVSKRAKPKYYGQFDETTFILGPVPDQAYNIELHYFYEPASLTSGLDNGTTWLSQNARDALLYGTLVEGAMFQKLPLNEVQAYESRFQEALAKLKAEQELLGTRQEYYTDRPRANNLAGKA